MSTHRPFWNLPNMLTLARITAVPVMVGLLWDTPEPGLMGLLPFGIFIAAMLTDVVDGYLARKWDLVTPMGAYLDPLADKLMVATTLIMLVPIGWVPAWLVALLLAREFAITGLRGIASQQGLVLSASALGKIKTAYHSTALGLILFHQPLFGVDIQASGMMLLYIGTLFSLASATEYFILFARAEPKLS